MAARVFISYARVDSGVAEQIASVLKDLRIDHFLDTKDIDWGASINEEIRRALRGCAEAVVVLSPGSLKSQWVPYEIGHATALGKKILPFLTHPSLEVPLYMRDLHFVATIDEVRQYFSPHRAVELTAPTEGKAASKSVSPKERDSIRSERNELAKNVIEKAPGVLDCFVSQLEDHTDKGYAMVVTFDDSTSAAHVVSDIRKAFDEIVRVPIWGEMQHESDDKVIFAYSYLDEYNRVFGPHRRRLTGR